MDSLMASSPKATMNKYHCQIQYLNMIKNLRVKTCMCSPSNHPLAFKCAKHRGANRVQKSLSYTSNNMILLKKAMKNSMLKKGNKRYCKTKWYKSLVHKLVPYSQELGESRNKKH
ncbi:hypothetical protein Lal_00031042 [Lupinus albus]|nr:hypothetical protein Lal_00031042 [Lupinus albus]